MILTTQPATTDRKQKFLQVQTIHTMIHRTLRGFDMWHIIASRHNLLQPESWQGQYYGDMQKQINELNKEGYKHFEVWEVENIG